MRYSLCYVLDQKTAKELDKVSSQVARIFRGQEIPVRWGKPSIYNIYLHNYNSNISFIKKTLLRKKLEKINYSNDEIKISLHRLKLGLSKRMKGLIYLSIDKGGEELRNMKSVLVEKLKIKDSVIFVPHIVIGRVSKELTRQEVSNIIRDFENLQGDIENIKFTVKGVELIDHDIK